ncbi:MAG: hypothetical protein AAGG11_17555 [Pseudomonadota bacterium]
MSTCRDCAEYPLDDPVAADDPALAMTCVPTPVPAASPTDARILYQWAVKYTGTRLE